VGVIGRLTGQSPRFFLLFPSSVLLSSCSGVLCLTSLSFCRAVRVVWTTSSAMTCSKPR
jgi:hypothetical protein